MDLAGRHNRGRHGRATIRSVCLSWLATLASRSPTACACSFKAGRTTEEPSRSKTASVTESVWRMVTTPSGRRVHVGSTSGGGAHERAPRPGALSVWQKERDPGKTGRRGCKYEQVPDRRPTATQPPANILGRSSLCTDGNGLPPPPARTGSDTPSAGGGGGAGLRTVLTRNEAQPFL